MRNDLHPSTYASIAVQDKSKIEFSINGDSYSMTVNEAKAMIEARDLLSISGKKHLDDFDCDKQKEISKLLIGITKEEFSISDADDRDEIKKLEKEVKESGKVIADKVLEIKKLEDSLSEKGNKILALSKEVDSLKK